MDSWWLLELNWNCDDVLGNCQLHMREPGLVSASAPTSNLTMSYPIAHAVPILSLAYLCLNSWPSPQEHLSYSSAASERFLGKSIISGVKRPLIPSTEYIYGSVDHGSPVVRVAVRLGAPQKLPAQLSIWIFIAHKSTVYEKVAFRFDKWSPVLRLVIGAIASASRAKRCEKRRGLARFDQRLHGYGPHRKSETRSWFCAWFCFNFVYITFLWNWYLNS